MAIALSIRVSTIQGYLPSYMTAYILRLSTWFSTWVYDYVLDYLYYGVIYMAHLYDYMTIYIRLSLLLYGRMSLVGLRIWLSICLSVL